MVPLRTDGSTLRSTVNESVPLPCPVVELPSWIQPLAAVADHSQSRLVVMVRVPAPPSTWNDDGVAVTVTPHFAGEGDVTVSVDELQAATEAAVIDNDNTNMNRDISFALYLSDRDDEQNVAQLQNAFRRNGTRSPSAVLRPRPFYDVTPRSSKVGVNLPIFGSGNRVSRQEIRVLELKIRVTPRHWWNAGRVLRSPLCFWNVALMIHGAGEHKQQVGQPVHVTDEHRIDWRLQ